MTNVRPQGYVYMITNNYDNMYYIGSHVGHNPNYMGSGTYLKSAQDKYGLDNFTKTILYYCDDFQEHEEQLLIALDAAGASDMYNLINSGTGSTLGFKFSQESRAKLSAAVSGPANPNYGKKFSDERRAKMSSSMRGLTRSEETRSRISASKSGSNHPYYGKKRPAEARANMSAAMTGIPKRKTTCPHCAKTGGAGNMLRYHFDNCKRATKVQQLINK